MSRFDAENERFRNTPEYIEHEGRLDNLLNELNEESKKRREEAKKHRPSRIQAKHVDFDSEAFKKAQHEKKVKRMESYSNKLNEAIKLFDELTEDEKKCFQSETAVRFYNDYDEVENPQTTRKEMGDLLDILVQTTIDFINERGLKDIDAVGFSADSLQTSAKYNEWVPDTDASITLYGLGKRKGSDGNDYYVQEIIGHLM